MSNKSNPYVCPAEFSGSLDNKVRKFVHDPVKILRSFITKGMTVLDLGCGPGYFTLPLSELVGDGGKVIAVDLQQGMLDKVREKMQKTGPGNNITLHKCESNKLGLTEKVDFILAFWMIHEVPDKERLITELKALLNPGGKIYIVEPKWHVTGKEFRDMIAITEKVGFKVVGMERVFFSRAFVLSY